MSNEKEICAIIVTYNPVIEDLEKTLNSLKLQNCPYIIIDNSPSKQVELIKYTDEYVWLSGNKGIAYAQNVGIKYCLDNNFANVIFFDQDSKIPDSFVSSMIDFASREKALIAAPVFYDEAKGFEYAITHINKNGTRVKIYSKGSDKPFTSSVVISSGTLVNCRLFEEIGTMDASLFIDYVDTEWCLRCFAKGYLVHINPSAVMVHSIGNSSLKILGFRVPVHSATRRYYRVRNSVRLFRYPHVPKLLAFREVIFSCIHSLLLIVHEKKRLDYFHSFINGIWDGVRNIGNENPRTTVNEHKES